MISGVSGCRYLLDTNIILYPQDPTDPGRKMRAIELILLLKARNNAALPAQAIAEFANAALRKFMPPMDWNTIYLQVEDLARDFPVLPLTPDVVLEALRARPCFFLLRCSDLGGCQNLSYSSGFERRF
ncbi:MAG: hypothetical protein EBE86_016900 [Hormoscilla sp. GUM202]|nr:hypothetical protein [Hormoscilla sp. GUM202]